MKKNNILEKKNQLHWRKLDASDSHHKAFHQQKSKKKTSNEAKKTSNSPKNKAKARLCLLSHCHERFSFQAAI